MSAAGKIDRSKITPPEIERFRADYEAPVTDTEKTICDVFGSVLGLGQIGILDDFVLLGGDSISALKIAMNLHGPMGINVSDILKHRTPQALAVIADTNIKNIQLGRESYETEEDNPVQAGELELSPFQETFYYEWAMDNGRSDYNIVDERLLERGVSEERLNSALIRMVNGYYIFHSNVKTEEDRLFWKNRETILDTAQLLTMFDSPPSEAELLSLVSAPFNLEQEFLFRFFLVKQPDGRSRFILVMHHILIDGTKAHEIYEEICNCYNNPAYSVVSDIETQKRLYWELSKKIRMALEEKHADITAFWDRYLQNSNLTELKFLRLPSVSNVVEDGTSDTREGSNPIGVYKFIIDKKDLGRIRVISQKYGITPYIYGQIIFAVLLHKMTGQHEVAFSFPSAVAEGTSLIYVLFFIKKGKKRKAGKIP
jgi:hypothetical protein